MLASPHSNESMTSTGVPFFASTANRSFKFPDANCLASHRPRTLLSDDVTPAMIQCHTPALDMPDAPHSVQGDLYGGYGNNQGTGYHGAQMAGAVQDSNYGHAGYGAKQSSAGAVQV